jgi:hypothetical protein
MTRAENAAKRYEDEAEDAAVNTALRILLRLRQSGKLSIDGYQLLVELVLGE